MPPAKKARIETGKSSSSGANALQNGNYYMHTIAMLNIQIRINDFSSTVFFE